MNKKYEAKGKINDDNGDEDDDSNDDYGGVGGCFGGTEMGLSCEDTAVW